MHSMALSGQITLDAAYNNVLMAIMLISWLRCVGVTLLIAHLVGVMTIITVVLVYAQALIHGIPLVIILLIYAQRVVVMPHTLITKQVLVFVWQYVQVPTLQQVLNQVLMIHLVIIIRKVVYEDVHNLIPMQIGKLIVASYAAQETTLQIFPHMLLHLNMILHQVYTSVDV